MSSAEPGKVSTSMTRRLRREQRQLRSRLGLDPHTIVTGKAGVAEVGGIGTRRLEHAVEREIAQGVGTQIAANLLHRVASPDQLLAGGRVDTVVAGPLDRRRGDADVHGARTGPPDHADDLAAGRT